MLLECDIIYVLGRDWGCSPGSLLLDGWIHPYFRLGFWKFVLDFLYNWKKVFGLCLHRGYYYKTR